MTGGDDNTTPQLSARTSDDIRTQDSLSPQGNPASVSLADDLFERLRDGDTHAAELLYLQYYARLLRFAYGYLRSRARAEEIVQDVFLALWERRATLDIHVSVNAYLYTAVRNRALRATQHDQLVDTTTARHASGDLPLAMGAPPPRADARLEQDELAARVMRAIAALPERRRLALTLRWRHQLPYADIATIMGASVEAVTIQVARAREQLARLLGEPE